MVAFEKVIKTLERFQDSKLKSFYLDSGHDGLKMIAPLIPAHASLHLSQSLYAMTCRLEVLRLHYVVNVSHFLKESCSAKGTTSESPPAWPRLKLVQISDYFDPHSADLTSIAAELHDAVAPALPQMPNLIQLTLSIVVPRCLLSTRRGYRQTSVHIETRQQYDASSVAKLLGTHPFSEGPRQGRLLLAGPAPEPETIDLWRRIARRQWDCNLRVRREFGGFTYWTGSDISSGQ